MTQEWGDIDEVSAYLELRRIDNKALLFCSYIEKTRELFPGENFVMSDLGWITEIARERILLKQDSLFLAEQIFPERKRGSALLPEEERVLFLWQEDGSIVVSSEDPHWSDYLVGQSYAKPLSLIERPGGATTLWRIPGSVFLLN